MKYKLKTVSIIIPLYNREELVRETLDSVLAQTYPHWECIIVDDVSTDNSLATAREYAARDSRFKVFQRHREPKGAPTCRNIGLEKAEGEYVIFLDSDDLLADFCLERRISAMHSDKQDFIVFQMEYLSGKENIECKHVTKRSENYLYAFLRHEIPWNISCPLWDIKILKALGGFNEKYPRLQDPEICTRALLLPSIRFSVLAENKADGYYRILHVKRDVISGLKGFYYYLRDFSVMKNPYGSKKELMKELRSCLTEAEKYTGFFFQRKQIIQITTTFLKIQFRCAVNGVIGWCKALNNTLEYFVFAGLTMINQQKAKSLFLKKKNS